MRRLLLVLAFLSPLAVLSAQENASVSSHDFLERIWSPYCKGNSLLECPSSKAEALRDEIESRLRQGESQASILADLEDRYGEQVYMEPDSGRAYWLPWVLFTLVLMGLGVFVFWKRSQRRDEPEKPKATSPDSEPLSDEMQSKVLKDLEEKLS